MQNMVKVFEGKEITIKGTKEEPLFLLKDVCDAIGLSNPSEVAKRIREKYKHQISLGLAGRTPLFISEPGLYQVIMRADQTPVAVRFQDWVYEEVLPSIRQNNGYQLPQELPLADLFRSTAQLIESQEQTKQDVNELKDKVDNQMTIDYAQQLAIEQAKKVRVETVWRDLEGRSEMYDTKRKVYSRIGNDLKRAFRVPSYRNIRRKDFDEAINYINGWRPALV